MPKLKSGDNAPAIALPAIDGSMFDLSQHKGKRVILTFFRFDSCPFCNIRIHHLTKRWGEFPEDTVMVGIFDANIEALTKRMNKNHKVPFTIVADDTYATYTENGVYKSILRVMFAPLRRPLTMIQAILKGYIPLTLSMKKMSTIPVDILIDEHGKVAKAHYCKDTVDHIPIDEMVRFAQGM